MIVWKGETKDETESRIWLKKKRITMVEIVNGNSLMGNDDDI